jgi:hypothetical protein
MAFLFRKHCRDGHETEKALGGSGWIQDKVGLDVIVIENNSL